MPRLVFISDTHNQLSKMKVPDGDVLIHVGDALGSGSVREFDQFADQFAAFPHKKKIYVPGNHDGYVESEPGRAREKLSFAAILIDEEAIFDGLRIYGSPYTPEFFEWHFMLMSEMEAIEKWNRISGKLDVLLTHGPPLGILDMTTREVQAGCPWLQKRVFQIKPRYHVFGHIHEGFGRESRGGIEFLNVSCVDVNYELRSHGTVVDIEPIR